VFLKYFIFLVGRAGGFYIHINSVQYVICLPELAIMSRKEQKLKAPAIKTKKTIYMFSTWLDNCFRGRPSCSIIALYFQPFCIKGEACGNYIGLVSETYYKPFAWELLRNP
jgi:hypothetical protein